MKKVLVAGATGYLGRYVIKELKKKGYSVRALTRDKNQLVDLNIYVDEVFEAEVTKPETLISICEDVDFVISSIGITRQKNGLSYLDVDYQGNKNILEEAQRSNSSKFIFVSVINAHLMKSLKMIQAKERFVDELKKSGIDYSVVRPTGFFSDMLEFLKMAKKGRVFLFGNGGNKINPIHGADLAEFCVNSIESTDNDVNIGGPETFTFKEIAGLAFKVLDKKTKISSLPIWILNIILLLLRLVTSSKVYGPFEFMASVMTMDVVGDSYGKERLENFFKQEV